jgi:hypothetical protein
MPRNNHKCDPNKVLIFDWDDTICPSSFVDRWGIENVKDLPKHVSEEQSFRFHFLATFQLRLHTDDTTICGSSFDSY